MSNRQYLIGYKGEKQCVYGFIDGNQISWVKPFSNKKDAKEQIKKFSPILDRVIYELVPIKKIKR